MKRLLIPALLATLLGCSDEEKAVPSHDAPKRAAAKVAAPQDAIEALSAPAGAGAAEPFLSATKDGVMLSWLEPVENTGRVALRTARFDGTAWSAPQTVVERNDLFVNWADFPSVVEDANGATYAHWLQKSGQGTYAYDVWMATAPAKGAWGTPFLLNRDHRKAEHGFATLTPLARGGAGVVWLDGRNMKEMAGEEEEHHAGDMSLRYAEIDAAGHITNESELDARTCECCTTGMTATSAGPLVVYRDRSPDEIRDIAYVRRTADGWSAPKLIHADDWKIHGCPVNGPQTDAIGDDVAVAWFTGANGSQRVYVAFSGDGGSTFGGAVQLDDAKPVGRVDVVMLAKNDALVSWLEQTTAGAEIRAKRILNGAAKPAIKIADASSARAAGFTRIARAGEFVYFTWTEQNGKAKSVKVARLHV